MLFTANCLKQDTEFPGVVARPMGGFTSRADYHYQTLRANVDLLSVIQLGITLFGPDSEMPPPHPENGPFQNSPTPCPHTWQFNFKFNQDTDMYNQESIDFLLNMGMNMDMHEVSGIDPKQFGAMLITSGLVMNDDVRWISFHSGYDFGYLVKLMYCRPLPDDELEYRKLLKLFFPAIFDIKFMVRSAQRTRTVNGTTPLSPPAINVLESLGAKAGLQDLADELGVKRIGSAHQAGSDSLLTGKVFWEARKVIFNNSIDEEKYLGQVWGLNGLVPHTPYTASGAGEGQSTPNINGATVYAANAPSPSTPQTTHSGVVQTPNQQIHGNGGTMTPGPTGGSFGRFALR
jgi:CCR4-NOT transcription complex subunit 7/8